MQIDMKNWYGFEWNNVMHKVFPININFQSTYSGRDFLETSRNKIVDESTISRNPVENFLALEDKIP